MFLHYSYLLHTYAARHKVTFLLTHAFDDIGVTFSVRYFGHRGVVRSI
jgi:hypothetical protein